VSSPSRVRGGAPAAIAFFACFRPQNTSGRKKNTILLPLVCVLENQIQAVSRTFRHRFKDVQGPCLCSRTFQALKIGKNYSRTFKDFQGPARALCICISQSIKTHLCTTSIRIHYAQKTLCILALNYAKQNQITL